MVLKGCLLSHQPRFAQDAYDNTDSPLNYPNGWICLFSADDCEQMSLNKCVLTSEDMMKESCVFSMRLLV